MSPVHLLDPNPAGNPPVLLLHGMGATGESWSLQFPPLINGGFRPLAPDVPGFGKSPYDGKRWSVERTAEEIIKELAAINSGPAHLVGLSMGGVIAQQIAHSHPAMTKKLVLASTFSRLRPETVTEWYYFLRRMIALNVRGLPAQAEIVADRVFPQPDQAFLHDMLVETISHSNKRAYREAMLALGRFNSGQWLGTVTNPTLVITGSDDTTVSPKIQKELAGLIPGAKHVIIEGGGHAVPVDHADQFNRALLEFLA